MMVYSPGDVLFYSFRATTPTDLIVGEWTNSRFVHVAIAVSAVMKVEATFSGVVQTPILPRSVDAYWSYSDHAQPLDMLRLAQAMTWVHSQVGQAYGWGDIGNAFMEKFIHGVSIDLGEHLDCSGLVTEALVIAGGVPALAGIDAHTITPAMLATLLGVH